LDITVMISMKLSTTGRISQRLWAV